MFVGIGLGIGFAPFSLNPIIALFGQNQQGAWYDPSDMTTLSQDSAGATPVTAVEQPVGLMLDKRLGLILGSEIALNGDMSAGTANYIAFSANTSLSAVSGVLRSTVAAGAGTDEYQIAATVIGKTYKYQITSSNFLAGATNFRVYAGTAPGSPALGYAANSVTTAGLASMIFTATTASTFLGFGHAGSVGSSVDFDNLTFRELPGNHASQATAASRPVLKAGGSMLMDGIDDSMSSATGGAGTAGFFFCQAVKPGGGAGAVRTLLSDSGTNSGYRVQLNASNQLSFSAGNGTTYTTIATATATTIGTTHLLTVWDDGTNLNVQLDSGTVATIARPVVTAGTAGFSLGKDNGAATGFFTGNLYPEIYRQNSGLTAAERAQVQAYVKSKAGL